MGCDIHYHAERKQVDGWVDVNLDRRGNWDTDRLGDRCYAKFAFLAGVRNYSDVTPLSEPRGFPPDASAEAKADFESWGADAHSASWLLLDEVLGFDLDAQMEDRRVTRGGNGGCTAEPGGGKMMTWREFLGQALIEYFEYMRNAGVERIVFWFDN